MRRWAMTWFPLAWRDKERRFRVAGEYRALSTSEHLLADLCMRNNVFADIQGRPGDAPSLFDIGVAEGRRRCVLEILELARTDPNQIAELELREATRGDRNVD